MTEEENDDDIPDGFWKFIGGLPASKDVKNGERRILECGNCGGKVYYSKAENNGHIFAKCCKCKMEIMQ